MWTKSRMLDGGMEMKKSEAIYQAYVRILEEELIPAMGCTEPIAVAYCGAVARQALGALPDRVEVEASGNIIKNVKSVVVPNTGIAGASLPPWRPASWPATPPCSWR